MQLLRKTLNSRHKSSSTRCSSKPSTSKSSSLAQSLLLRRRVPLPKHVTFRALAFAFLTLVLLCITFVLHSLDFGDDHLSQGLIAGVVLPRTPPVAIHSGNLLNVSLIMPLLHGGDPVSRNTTEHVFLSNLLGPLVQSEEALCYRSDSSSTQAPAYQVHAVVVSGATAASSVLGGAVRGVLSDDVLRGGDVLLQGRPRDELTPAQLWRAWELNMDAVRAALGGAARGGARCLGDRVTLVAPVAPAPDTAVEVLVDAALRTRGGRAGSHFVVLSSFLGAAWMPYTEPDDALETRHEGTGLLDALVRTATQRNGGRVAAAQCTILQHSDDSGGWRHPSPRLTERELASLRVVDKGGMTGTTHNGEVLQPYLTRRLSGYSAADQRASWEEVVDAVSLHCGIFDRRVYDAVGGLAGALSVPAVRDAVSARHDHAMGAVDRGGWALTLRMQEAYPAWQVWGSRAAAVVRDDDAGVRALPAVVSLRRPVFSLLDHYGHTAYNVVTELQRRRVGVPWRRRGEDSHHSAKWSAAVQNCLPPVIRYHTDFRAPCIGLNREAMAYIRPLMERYGIGVMGGHSSCPKSGDTLLRLAYAGVGDLFRSVPSQATQSFFRDRLYRRAALVFQHSRAHRFLPLPKRRSHECPAVYIGHSMSELSNIHQKWIVPMRTRADEIWTTADFFATIYRRNGVSPDKIRVVPEAVDVYEYDPANYARQPAMGRCASTSWCDNRPSLTEEERLQRYVFFSSFKWEDRKGWDVLLKAYWDAFGPSAPPELRERTTLVIKTRLTRRYSSGMSRDSVLHFIETWGRGGALPGMTSIADYPHLIIVTGEVSATEVVQMYANADAFVYPTKAEGWGLPAVEAMAMGLPVLVTEWSGPLRFMERDSCFRIPVDGLEEISPDSPYGYEEGMKMAIPSVEKTAELMQYVVEHPEHARRVGRRAREYAVRELSEEAVADRMDRLFVDSVIERQRG
ncbi:mannosyltransferase-like protein [Leishmania mexicana MHOM/GT/2001/U1103]|uniref:Mannosyltransferase-like protein n=1 Tax=Leishmania mexicana (strain MHOM/GT/2001/U1103) TaxID=929439 RepID=E9B1Y5_LEIMU|nr:mannosyltransferase-like protein [Leishmania mexicana MHOM/GT/2001/U1103]CBZ29242.1 mannosyltransferase-like protein [Leishmania mexicana MHOM/GT/2001/U1103]